MELFIWCLVLPASLFILIKASDYFVAAAEKTGLSLGMSSFAVGVIIVGLGTSLPELISSIIAVLKDASEIVIGNVLGSNIANIFLVLGIAAILGRNFKIKRNLLPVDLPVLLGSSFLLALMVWDAEFTLGEAIFCILCLVCYLVSSFSAKEVEREVKRPKAGLKVWLLLVSSPVFIFIGAKYTIEAVISISEILSIGTEVLALSVIALGTSLPEVAVTVSAAKRNNPCIAIGNIIGSNIFNTFGVMGLSALFGSLAIPHSVLVFSLPVSIVATLLCVIITVDRKVNRTEGGLLLIFYLYFICRLYGVV